MARALEHFRRFAAAREGNVALIVALTLPMLAGGAGLGMEAAFWYYDQVKLQQAADAAVYAAAVEDRAGSGSTVMTSAAMTAAAANGFASGVDGLTLHAPPTSGPNQNDHSVEVILTRTESRYFSQFFTTTPVVIHVRSVATFNNAANACILALNKGASRAIEFSGSSTVSLAGCNVMSNSIATDSIYSQGATHVTVPCLMTSGGVSINTYVNQTDCDSAITQLSPVQDPFKALTEPSVTGSCRPSNGATLQPGRYCGGLNLNGTTNLNPGTYIIDGGSLRVNGAATVTGSGVTFYLANNASVSFNGNATITLSAPTSGALSGILFFGSRSNSSSTAVTLNGTAGSVLTGAIYFPKQTVSYIGDMQGANGCTQVVADMVSWNGNANLGVNCTAFGMSALAVKGAVKLAE
jgi:Flp pilus assembly protein TadG